VKYFLLILFVTGVLAGGCEQDQKPENLIPDSTYVQVITELSLVRAFEHQHRDTVNTAQVVQKIFDKYHINREQFMESHRYYQDNIKAQKKRFQEVMNSLQKEMIHSEKSGYEQSRSIPDSVRRKMQQQKMSKQHQ